jgi:hypothetical protein
MKDIFTVAIIGAAIGYLAHAHWPEFEWIMRMLIA